LDAKSPVFGSSPNCLLHHILKYPKEILQISQLK